jgi:hypothetical protein
MRKKVRILCNLIGGVEMSEENDSNATNVSIQHDSISNHQNNRKKSSKPVIAGSLLLIIGIIGIIFSAFVVGGGIALDNFEDIPFEGFTVTNIHGKITDSSGVALENVSISIVDSHLHTTSDENGFYEINGIPSGYHQLIFEKSGYTKLIYYTYILSFEEESDFMHEFQDNNQDNPLVIDNENYNFQLNEGSDTYVYGSEIPPHKTFFNIFGGFISGLGVITLFCSILSIVGGYFAINRRKHVLVILCSIAAIFSFGFFIGSLLAIIALIIIIISSNEFEEKNNQAI